MKFVKGDAMAGIIIVIVYCHCISCCYLHNPGGAGEAGRFSAPFNTSTAAT